MIRLTWWPLVCPPESYVLSKVSTMVLSDVGPIVPSTDITLHKAD